MNQQRLTLRAAFLALARRAEPVMNRSSLPLVVILLACTSCQTITLDMTNLRKPVMLNSHPAGAESTQTQEPSKTFTDTSWIRTQFIAPNAPVTRSRREAVANAQALFGEGCRTISSVRIKVSSNSAFSVLSSLQYVAITLDGEAHK